MAKKKTQKKGPQGKAKESKDLVENGYVEKDKGEEAVRSMLTAL